jgi:hypothetical protein
MSHQFRLKSSIGLFALLAVALPESGAYAGPVVWDMSVCLRSLKILGPQGPGGKRIAHVSKKGDTHIGIPGGGLVVSPDPPPLKPFGKIVAGQTRTLEPAFHYYFNQTAYNCPLHPVIAGSNKKPPECFVFVGDDDKRIDSKYGERQFKPSAFKVDANDNRIIESNSVLDEEWVDCTTLKCESETDDKKYTAGTPLKALDDATKDALGTYAGECTKLNQAIIADNLARNKHHPTKDCFRELVDRCSKLTTNNKAYEALYRKAYQDLAAQPEAERGGNPPKGGVTAREFK